VRFQIEILFRPFSPLPHFFILHISSTSRIKCWVFLWVFRHLYNLKPSVNVLASKCTTKFQTHINPIPGPTQLPIQWVPGALSLGVKRPRRKADHSPPSSTEVRNAWSYTSTPQIRLHGVVLS